MPIPHSGSPMGQILHGSAKTTHVVRAAIQRSKASIKELAGRYDLNPKTVTKWKKRAFNGQVERMNRTLKERVSGAITTTATTSYANTSQRSSTPAT